MLVHHNVFVDEYHAVDCTPQRSHTGISLLPNKTPVFWYSKQHNIVEFSMFVSEFITISMAQDMVLSIHYKLIMMGFSIDRDANAFSDNEAVLRVPYVRRPR